MTAVAALKLYGLENGQAHCVVHGLQERVCFCKYSIKYNVEITKSTKMSVILYNTF